MAKDEAYRKAEEKIEAARRSQATELDLGAGWEANDSEKLTELPESVSQLTELQNLNLSGNRLTAVPESLGQLTQLLSLNLRSNQLTSLPESFGGLTQLEELNLSHNELTGLPASLGRLTHLKSLNGAGNQLTSLPESFGNLTQLVELNLSNNKLIALPASLGRLMQLQSLFLFRNELTALPDSMGQLKSLDTLEIAGNRLDHLPEWIGNLASLRSLLCYGNPIKALPDAIRKLTSLTELSVGVSTLPDWLVELHGLKKLGIGDFRLEPRPLIDLPLIVRRLSGLEKLNAIGCALVRIPEWLGELSELKELYFQRNRITDLPPALGELKNLEQIALDGNPLNPELAAAHKEGFDAVKRYLLAKAKDQVVLNEAKLILVGEGEVGKSCLLGALRGDEWIEGRDTTHGIEIKPVKVTDPNSGTELTLNGWDFGGQRVYRPTHQLFFSSPAVYLVVWKPREGPQQGFVKDWIKLVKHREPDAKILVVATHGGPKERQPDIDRQEIWDLFGKETVIDFFHVDSKPPELDAKTGGRAGEGDGIKELKDAIMRVAAALPEMGRTFPKHWQEAREVLRQSAEAYLPLNRVFDICEEHAIDKGDARLLLRICHRIGDLIHYEHDPTLRDIVVLKPDWLATAISFVLDDKDTRDGHGLVTFSRLRELWNDVARPKENRYPPELHPLFLRLMERFDLSYRIAESGNVNGTSLIAQLVPDVRPERELGSVWQHQRFAGDDEQTQICRIVETMNNQSAPAEGLFYQLIVRLHKFSLGRANFRDSVHWQRGLVLEDETGARALMEHVGNDVRITVRSPYPDHFLTALTDEVRWLVESFWSGLLCQVTVPCLVKQANRESCRGLFEVRKLLENRRRGRPEQPCAVCNEWQSIDQLLDNAPAARPNPIEELVVSSSQTARVLNAVRRELVQQSARAIGRFDQLDAQSKEIVSKVEAAYSHLMRTLLDQGRDGPRLFSFEPAGSDFFDRPNWERATFRVTLWCEHSRLPLTALNGEQDKRGVYLLIITREWMTTAAPFLKLLTSTLGLVAPVASATGPRITTSAYEDIEKQLSLSEKSLQTVLLKEGAAHDVYSMDPNTVERVATTISDDAVRYIQRWVKQEDPAFGGLVRVLNKRQEFLWVHPMFENEY